MEEFDVRAGPLDVGPDLGGDIALDDEPKRRAQRAEEWLEGTILGQRSRVEDRRPSCCRLAHRDEGGLEAVRDLLDPRPGMPPLEIGCGLRRHSDERVRAVHGPRLESRQHWATAIEGRVLRPEIAQLDDERRVTHGSAGGHQR
jgi:hypothetical protein